MIKKFNISNAFIRGFFIFVQVLWDIFSLFGHTYTEVRI